MAIQLDSSVARKDGLMSAEIDQEIVILGLVSNNYIALDKVGRRIWDLIEKPVAVSALCAQLGKEYAGAEARIQADVLAFLTQLETEGLVRVE